MGSPCGKFLDTPLMRNLGGRKIIPARNQMKFQRCPCELACCFAYERSLPVIAVCSRPAWWWCPTCGYTLLSLHPLYDAKWSWVCFSFSSLQEYKSVECHTRDAICFPSQDMFDPSPPPSEKGGAHVVKWYLCFKLNRLSLPLIII